MTDRERFDRERDPWGGENSQPTPPAGGGATGVFGSSPAPSSAGQAAPWAEQQANSWPAPQQGNPWPPEPPRAPAYPPAQPPHPSPAPQVHEVVVRPEAGGSVPADPLERMMRAQAARPQGAPSAPYPPPAVPNPAPGPGSFTAFLEAPVSPSVAPEPPAPAPRSAGSFTQLFQEFGSAPAPSRQESVPPPSYNPVLPQTQAEQPGGPVLSSPAPTSTRRRETRFYPEGVPSMGQPRSNEQPAGYPPAAPATLAQPTERTSPGSFTQLFAASETRRDPAAISQADEAPPLPNAQRSCADAGPVFSSQLRSRTPSGLSAESRPGSLTQMLQSLDSPGTFGQAPPAQPPQSFNAGQPFGSPRTSDPLPASGSFPPEYGANSAGFAPGAPGFGSDGPSPRVGGATTAFSVPQGTALSAESPKPRGPGEFTRIMQASQMRPGAPEATPPAEPSVAQSTAAGAGGFPAMPQWGMPQFQQPQMPQMPQFQAPQMPAFAPPQAPAVPEPVQPAAKGPPWLIIGLIGVIVLLLIVLLLVLLLRK